MVTGKGEIIVQDFRGINVKQNNFNIDDSECQIATNVVVTNGAVEVRGGFSLHSSNVYDADDNPDGVTGGIPFMTPYYKLDGTTQLVFGNKDKYYYITPDDTTWHFIGDYGVEVPNPTAYQFKDVLVFGTGKIGNKSYTYNAKAKTYTANTISFENNDPVFPIKDSANGFTFEENDVITVSGSASNDGIYTTNGVGPNLVQVDEGGLVNEAAGAMITITATGFKRLLSTQAADSTGDLRFYCQFGGKDVKYLCGAGLEKDNEDKNITTLFYTSNPYNWASGGVIQVGPGDGDDITGLVQNNILISYKEAAKHYFDDFYQEDAGTFALRENGKDPSSGAANHESLLTIDSDVVALVGRGRSIEGYGLEGTAQGNGRSKQYATNINPLLDLINWKKDVIKSVRGAFVERKCFYAAPFNGANFNNILFVGDWDMAARNGQPSWTTWSNSIGSMVRFQDENNVKQFYLADALQPRIYRYNSLIYSDVGLGYRRIWKSKKFTLGRRPEYAKGTTVIIQGFMREMTEFKLTVYADGKPKSWRVTKTQLIQSEGGGGLIGDNLYGDEYNGGDSGESDKFRYQAVVFLPNEQRYTKNIEVEIENFEPGHYWSLDYLSINEQIEFKNIPDRHKNLTAFQNG